MSLFAGDFIVHVENPKELTKNCLELISNYNKFAEYKVNLQKSVAFLYTSNLQVEFEIKNNNIYIDTPMKYVGINQTKYVQDF